MRDMLKNLGKLAAAGTTICAIGAGMLVLQPTPETPVAEAEADIFGFEFAEKSQQQKFVTTLMNEGMEEPRVYDHNGNTMFFSTTLTEESPRQVMERFQRGFVETGLNERVHLSLLEPPSMDLPPPDVLRKDRAKALKLKDFADNQLAYMNDYVGGMVPVVITEDIIMMTGTTTKQDADGMFEWVQELADDPETVAEGKLNLGATAKAMRYVDAFREGKRTRVTAVWSDQNFEPLKMADIGEDLNVDPDVPSCPGCKRLLHIEGKTEKAYANHAFDAGRQSVEQVFAFYDQTLTSRGWKLSDVSSVLDAAEQLGYKDVESAKMRQYARGTEFMTVLAWPSETGTGLHIARSN